MYTVELNFNKDQFYAFQDFESCWETFILIVSCQIPFTQFTNICNMYTSIQTKAKEGHLIVNGISYFQPNPFWASSLIPFCKGGQFA